MPAAGYDRVILLAVENVLAGEFRDAVDGDHAFDEDFRQLDEETEFLHGDDQRVVLLAEMLLHELRGFPGHQFALGGFGAALGLGRFRGDGFEFAAAIRAECGFFLTWTGVGGGLRLGMIERPLQDAMHDQVGIAADRRSEMRVLVEGQREMAERVGGVARLLQRTQH